jgi:hypothetical protein
MIQDSNSRMLALLLDLRAVKARTDCCVSCVICQQTRDYWKPECKQLAKEHGYAQRSARACA